MKNGICQNYCVFSYVKSYPVERIKSDSIGGNSLACTKGFLNIIKLLWSQAKPIFLPPMLGQTWKLCFLIFVVFAIGHGTLTQRIYPLSFFMTKKRLFLAFSIKGTFMWFPDFLVQLQNYHGPAEILCQVVAPKTNSKENDFKTYGLIMKSFHCPIFFLFFHCLKCHLHFRCDGLDNKNTKNFQILLGVGAFFMSLATLSSYLIKKISPKKIICKSTVANLYDLNNNSDFFLDIWILVSSACCLALNFLSNYNGIVMSFIVFLSCCNSANVVMSVAVNLYPTQYKGKHKDSKFIQRNTSNNFSEYKGIATAVILMMGRLGGFFGSNLVGILLSTMCTLLFYANGALLISK